MDKLNDSKQVKERKNSCGGCLIMLASAFIILSAIASLFSETPEEKEAKIIKENKELVIEWARKQRTDFSFQGASTFLDTKQFRCFMDLDESWAEPDYKKLIRLFQEDKIDEYKFKHEIEIHFEQKWRNIYLECGKIR